MESLSAATGIEIASGFRWLETVDEAFEVMLPVIESARVSIRFEVYIYRVSPIGEAVREALIRASQRGVKVRVMVDALGSISLPEKFWDPLIQAGGQFKWFNPLKWKRLGFRNHRKTLVVDEKIAFIGGFNVAPEYQGDGVTKGWHDLGLQVPQALAGELAAAFDAMFAMAEFRQRRLIRYRRSNLVRLVETPEGTLLTNGPGRGPYLMTGALLRDIHSAETIDIISAYFLPPRQLRRAMMRASRQGRRVRLILAGKSDVKLSQLASRHLYKGLLRAGIQIYEYQPQILHTKLYLFDDTFYVGSANMDKRSLMVNYELLVRVKHRNLSEYGRVFFEGTLKNCKLIDPVEWRRSRTFWNRLREQWAYFLLSKVDPYLTQLQLDVMRKELVEQTQQAAAARQPS